MNFTQEEISALTQLKKRFITESFSGNYWEDIETLSLYHQTFGQRIKWKWEWALNQIESLPTTTEHLIDIGTGSGVAFATYCEHFDLSPQKLTLIDQDPLCEKFIKQEYANLPRYQDSDIIFKTQLPETPTDNSTVLISHLLNELSSKKTEELIKFLCHSNIKSIFWLEHSERKMNPKFIEIKEQITAATQLQVTLPCPHQKPCPLYQSEFKNHPWCHFFATPPNEIFHSSYWGEFSRKLNIDLRSLPLSYFYLSKKPSQNCENIIGRPQRIKKKENFLLCHKEGVTEATRPYRK